MDAVIDVPGTCGELTQIAFMRRLTRAGAVVASTAAAVAGLLSDWRKPQAAGTLGIPATRSRTMASWSTLESSHVAA